MERLVRFEVMGQEYPLLTDAPEEDLQEILHLVKSQIEDQSKSSKSLLPANKVAVLSSLNMASKYVQLKREFEQYKKELKMCVDHLTTRIDQTLAAKPEAYQVRIHDSLDSSD